MYRTHNIEHANSDNAYPAEINKTGLGRDPCHLLRDHLQTVHLTRSLLILFQTSI